MLRDVVVVGLLMSDCLRLHTIRATAEAHEASVE